MNSVIKTTILGCGSSGGVPRIDGDWGVCDPNNVKNIRSRCSILVEKITNDKKTVVLIDTSPDMRQQLLKAGVTNIDAVLYTHDHADQSGGIDDLRVFALRKRERVNVYLDKDTASRLIPRFNYCFKSGEKHGYPSILSENIIDPYKELIINRPIPFTKITNKGLWHLRFSYLLRIPPFFFFQFLLVLTYQLFLSKVNLNVLKEFFCSCKLKHCLLIILTAFSQMIL